MGTASVEDMMSGGVGYNHNYLTTLHSHPPVILITDMGPTDHRPLLEDSD